MLKKIETVGIRGRKRRQKLSSGAKDAETKSRVAALREKVQDEDTIKKQERVLKTELANAEKEEAPLKKNWLRLKLESTDSEQVLRQKKPQEMP